MKSNIKVSVIIPTYKRAAELKRAVESVISQTLKEIEIIVVDDNPPESDSRVKTEKIMEELQERDGRIRYIKHERNMNGATARNTGIKNSQGKYISFLDDDDFYLPTKLEKESKLLDSLSSEYACVICNCYSVRNGVYGKVIEVDGSESPLQQVLSCTYRVGSGSNLFIRRDVMIECGGFNEKLLRHQDYDVEARVYSKYKVKKISEPLLCVELYSSHSNIPDLDKAVKYREEYLRLHKQLIESLPHRKRNEVYADSYYNLCELAIRNKRLKDARKLYLLSKSYIQTSRNKRIMLIMKCVLAYMPVKMRKALRIGR